MREPYSSQPGWVELGWVGQGRQVGGVGESFCSFRGRFELGLISLLRRGANGHHTKVALGRTSGGSARRLLSMKGEGHLPFGHLLQPRLFGIV